MVKEHGPVVSPFHGLKDSDPPELFPLQERVLVSVYEWATSTMSTDEIPYFYHFSKFFTTCTLFYCKTKIRLTKNFFVVLITIFFDFYYYYPIKWVRLELCVLVSFSVIVTCFTISKVSRWRRFFRNLVSQFVHLRSSSNCLSFEITIKSKGSCISYSF